jgi:hypothetical protein
MYNLDMTNNDDVRAEGERVPAQRVERVTVTNSAGEDVEAWRYSDGSIRNDRGHFVSLQPVEFGTHIISSEDAAALAKRKHDKTRQKIEAALVNTARQHGVDAVDGADAAGHAAGLLWADVVLNSEAYPRDRREVWRDLVKAAGLVPDGKKAAQNSDQAAITFRFSPDFAARVAELLQQRRAGRAAGVSYGEIVDNDV